MTHVMDFYEVKYAASYNLLFIVLCIEQASKQVKQLA